MKNSWLIWVFIVAVVITVFFAFNYQGNDTVPLSEIFPEEEAYPVDIEYEFVDSEAQPQEAAGQTAQTPAAKPATVQARSEAPQVQEKVAQAPQQKSAPALTPAVQEVSRTTPAKSQVLSSAQIANTPYTIQVASFKELTRAEQALAKVKEKNYDGYIASKDLGAKGTWYRVYVGKFNSKEEGQTFLNTIKKDFKDSFLISPKL